MSTRVKQATSETCRLANLLILMIVAASCGLVSVSCDFNKDGSVEGEQARPRYRDFPVPGASHANHAFQLIEPLNGRKMEFEVSIDKDSLVEVGVIRIDNTSSFWGYSGDYRFRVYQKRLLGKEILVEEARHFKINEHARFAFEGSKLETGNTPQRIIFEIEKTEKNKAKGYEAYKDFAFLVPNIFSNRKPDEYNVVLISLDTLRLDHLGYYGYNRDTSPNIDKFASDSSVFMQAISPSSWTAPAHYSLMTSLYPSAYLYRVPSDPEENVIENIHFMPADNLASALRRKGYYSIGINGGGLLGVEFGFGRGFNKYWEYSSYIDTSSPEGPWVHENDTEKIFGYAIDWLKNNRDKKFFMFLHTYECHTPYEGTLFLSDETDTLIEKRTALYDGDIKVADEYFGKLIDTMKSLDIYENTIVIFVSDHGDDFYDHYREEDLIPAPSQPAVPPISLVDHGHSLYDELILVPMIIRVPGVGPKVIDNQVRLIDVMPTVLDLLKAGHEGPIQGTSLAMLMKNGEREKDPPALSEFLHLGPERKSIRFDDRKYIWIKNPELCWNYEFRGTNPKELFDLKNDPGEKKNIYEANKSLAEEYHTVLLREIEASETINKILRAKYQPGDAKRELDPDKLEQLKALGYIK